MNKENILKVADAIERHSIPGLGFNMAEWSDEASLYRPDMSGHDCGTVACIGGWTERLFPAALDATRALGLSRAEDYRLFCPPNYRDNTYTPAEAVAVLRHLAETGEVDWSVAGVTP